MPLLDPRVRCNRCGAPFAEGSAEVCPSCGADLAVVGTWSELRDWGVTRQRGRAWFVWRRCVLGRGGLLAGIQCAVHALWGEDDPVEYALAALWPISWYFFGLLHWREAEREYAAWVARAGEQRHAEPGAAPDPRCT